MEHFEIGEEVELEDDEGENAQFLGRQEQKAPFREGALFSKENMAIPVYYAMLGFMRKFIYVALRIYLRDTLSASPSQQAIVYAVVIGMPWNLKAFMGFVSDSFPICGLRRKPYMLMGMAVCSLSWILFGILPSPSLVASCSLIFFAVFGLIFADVMADALVVEIVRCEKTPGGVQSTCWMLRF